MKKTLITKIPDAMPSEIYRFTEGRKIFDSSSSPEAKVYYIDRDGGYYLKRGERGTLASEAQMSAYFHKKGIGAKVLYYGTLEYDWLLTEAVSGEDCTSARYLSSPGRLSALLGERLRELHETDFSDCPIKNRTHSYIALAEKNFREGSYDKSHFPDSFGYRSAEEAYKVFSEGKGLLRCDTLIHGDFCLPNICLLDWKLSGYIDLGGGGGGDRHIDLFWGGWTLGFNLGTDAYRDTFFDAYGRDKIDMDILKTVAAAEVFG